MKKNKWRRIFSAIICAAMFVTSIPTISYSADNSSSKNENAETTEMRKALKDVKSRIPTPENFNSFKFNYDIKTSYENVFYHFVWKRYTEREYNGEIYHDEAETVEVEYYNGFISNYEYTDHTSQQYRSFSKLTSEEQDAFAKKYLYMLNPDLKGKPVITRVDKEKSLTDFNVKYRVTHDTGGIDFSNNYGTITVDRDTGALLDYSFKWWNDAVFPDASKRLSEREVSRIYASRKPLKAEYELFYKKEYDDETDKYKSVPFIIPVYSPSVDGENEIDALTGKYTSLYKDKEKYSYTSAYTWRDYGGDTVCAGEGVDKNGSDELSISEKEALKKENEYISYEKAISIIKADKYIVLNNELVKENSLIDSYINDKGEECPSRYVKLKYTSPDKDKDSIGLSVEMDAFTGEIIWFKKYYNYGSESPNKNAAPIKESSAMKLANEAAKHFIGDRADEYVSNTDWSEKNQPSSKNISYTRYVNGLPTGFDEMNIIVNSSGEVLSFSHTYHDMEFPKADLIPEGKAYDKLFEKMKPYLYYTGFTDLQLNSHIYLTYKFDSSYSLNALTGERIDYYGKAYYTEDNTDEETPEPKLYTDIKGYKYENEITTLWNYGVRITDSSTLGPDNAITIEEFLDLVSEGLGLYTSKYYIYPSIERQDPKTKEINYVDNPMLKEKLTYGELVKIYVYWYTDCFEAAKIEGIYTPPYKNISKDNDYCGYIAIAKALNLIGDSDEFPYDRKISRGSALKIVYDFLASDRSRGTKCYEIFRI